MPKRFSILGKLGTASGPLDSERFAVGSLSMSMSRGPPTSPDSDAESAAERGMEAVREELPAPLELLAPGKGIPARAPLGPIVLYVDSMKWC